MAKVSSKTVLSLLGSVILIIAGTLATTAEPVGGSVVAGEATIAASDGGRQTRITQSSEKAIINWASFNVLEDELVNFVQPSGQSIALNRVTGPGQSTILGTLTANGRVWIINRDGVLFGPTAQIDVSGLLATTLDISDADFINGNYTFKSTSAASGAVANHGTISAKAAGFVGLVAPHVENSGTITANLGYVTLAAAEGFTLDPYGDGKINFHIGTSVSSKPKSIGDGTPKALAEHSGTIIADGGQIQIAASALNGVVQNVVNVSGIVQARSVQQVGGQIVLDGGQAGSVEVSGKLDATSLDGVGGRIDVLGGNIALKAGARLDASGNFGGGTIRVGGDFKGAEGLRKASRTTVDRRANVLANAGSSGDGGKIAFWANDSLLMDGQVQARGGLGGGDGGSVETSGDLFVGIDGATIDTSAPMGQNGTWLVDPFDVDINQVTALNADVLIQADHDARIRTLFISIWRTQNANNFATPPCGPGCIIIDIDGPLTVQVTAGHKASIDQTVFYSASSDIFGNPVNELSVVNMNAPITVRVQAGSISQTVTRNFFVPPGRFVGFGSPDPTLNLCGGCGVIEKLGLLSATNPNFAPLTQADLKPVLELDDLPDEGGPMADLLEDTDDSDEELLEGSGEGSAEDETSMSAYETWIQRGLQIYQLLTDPKLAQILAYAVCEGDQSCIEVVEPRYQAEIDTLKRKPLDYLGELEDLKTAITEPLRDEIDKLVKSVKDVTGNDSPSDQP